MTKVIVLSILPGSALLKTEPYWSDPKLNTYISQDEVDEIREKVSRIKFPCEMIDTGKKDFFGKRLIMDEFGILWSEAHFSIKKAISMEEEQK